MSDSVRRVDDGGPASAAAVSSLGAVLSAVTLGFLFLSLTRGPESAVIWGGAVGALVATGAFLASRYGLLERAVAGPIGAGSSLLVVALSAFAIMQGTLGSVVLPGLEWSVSSLFAAFFVGAGVVGVGVAEYAHLSGRELVDRLTLTVEMIALAVVGLFGMSIAYLFLELPVMLAVGEPTATQQMTLEYLSTGVGLGAVAAGYLAYREHDWSFIDLEWPTRWTVAWIVVGSLLIIGVNIGASSLMTFAGIEGSEHSLTQDILENPSLLVIIVPAMVLIVGPFEELLYRNVVQKSLYSTFSRTGAVVVASVVFTLVHIIAYATAGAGEILASLSLLFVLSLILGGLYARTENLLVPALAHGCYNAVVVSFVVL
ncbi:CPBP family intramembrane glutamic endopeptidase [Natronorubrum daqingense]|uniref:Abortive phage infection protein n=1 Tax=Natronorubrum daqingense TaxID=588898 RepID=A0A1N6ZSG8_9EURY|nr:type II CAAX endopeptidase family protein [Natronorubrum daqingense]APX95262.1 abortive phage infection protein [Natronorubrum daqingense]SIR29853.1 hypothetical protein SAMN05421809_0901 [Natronorubrum daqingense]